MNKNTEGEDRAGCCDIQYYSVDTRTDLIQNSELSKRGMNWVQRKIYLYNVTFGLYMLDWWERCLFNTIVLVLLWFMCYNGIRFFSQLGTRYLW